MYVCMRMYFYCSHLWSRFFALPVCVFCSSLKMSKRVSTGVVLTTAEKMIKSLPQLKNSGDLNADQLAQGRRDKLEALITEVVEDADALESATVHLDQRRKSKALQEAQADMLAPCQVLGRLHDDVKVKLLVKDSDMSTADILAAKKVDFEADKQMLVFKYGMSLGFRLGDTFRYWPVLDKVFSPRAEVMGSRMQRFKDNFVGADGAITWKGATYNCAYTGEHVLKSVRHIGSGDIVNTPAWAQHITREYSIIMGWDDMNAAFERKPAPPVPLWKLFMQENKKAPPIGPFKIPQMKGQLAKDFYALAEDEKTRHLNGVKAAKQAVVASTGGTEAEDEVIRRQVEEFKAEKAQQSAKGAQMKIAASLEAKARKRRILNRTQSQEVAAAAAAEAEATEG